MDHDQTIHKEKGHAMTEVLSEASWFEWGFFGALVLTCLVIDLGVFHRRPHEIKMREAWPCWRSFIGSSMCLEGS